MWRNIERNSDDEKEREDACIDCCPFFMSMYQEMKVSVLLQEINIQITDQFFARINFHCHHGFFFFLLFMSSSKIILRNIR